MSYVCMNCRKEFKLEDMIRCPFCGFRIVAKTRPPFKKRVKAR